MNVLFLSFLQCSGCVTRTSGLLSFLIEKLYNWLLRYAALMRIVFLLFENQHFLVCFNGLKVFFLITCNGKIFVFGGLFLIFCKTGM